MSTLFSEIKNNLETLYLEDERPWLVGFSGGKDSSMVASLIFDVVLGLPPEKRTKPIAILCTDTRVEIPAIVEMVETTLAKMQKCSKRESSQYRSAFVASTCRAVVLGQCYRARLSTAQSRVSLVHFAPQN